jgi:NAD(P)-dependent dehydrogenase (short-subunit alcohol dehydrogenase family)
MTLIARAEGLGYFVIHIADVQVQKELGSINCLCCFAGVVSCGPSLEVGIDEWKRVMDINLTGAFLCAQAVAR